MPITPARSVADVIAAYVEQHPLAADSVEGIHLWWLDSLFPLETTQAALELLEEEGLLERLPSGRVTVWRRRRDRQV